jgi:hypothetical protein
MNTRLILLGTIAVVTLLSLGSCKTTEQNYRNAYEIAKQAKYTDVDSITYDKIRKESIPTAIIANGDSIRSKTLFITASKDKNGNAYGDVRRYNVVVGQFKQIFNARAMMSRLSNNGYTGSYIVETREPIYYVVSEGCDDLTTATNALQHVASDNSLMLSLPFPWILESASIKR